LALLAAAAGSAWVADAAVAAGAVAAGAAGAAVTAGLGVVAKAGTQATAKSRVAQARACGWRRLLAFTVFPLILAQMNAKAARLRPACDVRRHDGATPAGSA
jgi:hypothetical protein